LPIVWPSAKRIQHGDAELLKVSYVSSDDGQIMYPSGSRDHRILDDGVRTMMHETRPLSEGRGIHRQNAVSLNEAINPSLDFVRLGRILLASNFDTGLKLTDCDCRNIKGLIGDPSEPSNESTVRTRSPKLGYDVCIEKKHWDSDKPPRSAASTPTANRRIDRDPGVIGQEELLQGWTCRLPQAAPLLDRYQDGRLSAALCHDLRSFSKTGIQEFAESRLGVLNRPTLHIDDSLESAD
jgi:hypothetical protein